MRDAIDPRPQRTSIFEPLEAAPKGDVNLLQQIAALVRIGLVSADEPLQSASVDR